MPVYRPVGESRDILEQMSADVLVPPNAKGSYTDFQKVGLPFRLYVLSWTLFETEMPEWSLLLCLEPIENSQLPPGIRLIIRDQTCLLTEQVMAADSEFTCLYGQVIGSWDEQFIVTVEPPNGPILVWPPFVFNPMSESEF